LANILEELTSLRTKKAKHYRLDNGKIMAVLTIHDQHYEDPDTGELQTVDTAFELEAGFGQKAKKQQHHLRFYDNNRLRFGFAKQVYIDYTLPGAPGISANRATINEAWENTDLEYVNTDRGIKSDILLKAPGHPESFAFPVELTGCSVWIGNNEAVFYAEGQEVGKIPAPYMVDRAGQQGKVSVDYDGQAIVFTPDVRWLADEAVYPVRVDPTTVTLNPGNTAVIDAKWNTYAETVYDSLGISGSFETSGIRLDLSSIPLDADISSAKLYLYVNNSWAGPDVAAYEITSTWDETSYPPPSHDSTKLDTEYIESSTGWEYLDLASSVQRMVSGAINNYGWKLVCDGCVGSQSAVFNDSEDASNKPYLSVIYSTPPTVPVLTDPNGGESIQTDIDPTFLITWNPSTSTEVAQNLIQYHIQYSPDNGSNWTDIVALTTAGATSYEHDFSGVTEGSQCLIRIRAYDGVRYGAYDQSDGVFTVTHNVAPEAPTNLDPASDMIDRTTIHRLSWQFNDPNSGDYQTKYDLHWSSDAGTTWNEINGAVSANEYRDINSGTFPAGDITWKVRCYDKGGLVSPWSQQAVFTAADAPSTLTIDAPPDPVPVARPVISWTSIDQTAYQVQVLDSLSNVVWDTGPVVSINMAVTCGIDLVNGASYILKVKYQDSTTLWGDWATKAVTVSYTPPALAILTMTDQAGYINIAINNPAPQGTEPTVTSNDLYRKKHSESTWTRIVIGLANDGTYDDYTVESGVTYDYRVVSYADNGTSSTSGMVSESITLIGIWLHDVASPAGTAHNYQRDGQERGHGWQAEAEFLQFAGRARPVVRWGEAETENPSATLLCVNGSGDYEALDALVKLKGTICYRDGASRKVFGIISSLPVKDEIYGAKTVAITVMEIDYSEVV